MADGDRAGGSSIGGGNVNYSGFSASAGPTSGGQQLVGVSGNVLVPNPGVSASLAQTRESGGSESTLFLALTLSGGASEADDHPAWVPVAFHGPVKLQGGNPVTQVEILSSALGNLTVDVDSARAPAGVRGSPPSAAAARAAAPASAPAPAGGTDSADDESNPNYKFVHAYTHQFQDIMQMLVVYGYVQVANPGLQPVLREAEGGGDGDTLALELDLWQRPGSWEQKESWAMFNYGVTTMLGQGTPATRVTIASDTLGGISVPAQPL
jgi:hypothetical protein